MPLKRSTRGILATIFIVAMLALFAAIYALFHGYFDHGRFEILDTQWTSNHHHVAMIARRTDNEALGGYEVFALVGDHVYSRTELRHALYSNRVIFSSNQDCVTVTWISPQHLVIGCTGKTIEPDSINVERQSQDDLTITYQNIAAKPK